MPLNVTVRFESVTWDDDARAEIGAAQQEGHAVWLFGAADVIGGPNAGHHEAWQLVPDDARSAHGMQLRFDAEDAERIDIRFQVEFWDPTQRLYATIIRDDVSPPFFLQRPRKTRAQYDPPRPPIDMAYELAWEVIPERDDILTRTPSDTGPFPAARNLTTTAVSTKAPDCWQYNPVRLDALVVDKHEFKSPVANLRNWQGWDTSFNKKKGPLSTVGHRPKHPIGGKKTICRDLSRITAIVVHEISGWVESFHAVPGIWFGKSTAAHFILQSNGDLSQLYDCVQRVTHANNRNRHSVGIECSGRVWTKLGIDETFTPPSSAKNADPRTVVKGWAWSGSNVIVPPLAQLEALHDLIQGLLAVMPGVPDEFPGLTQNGEPHRKGDFRKLFLMSTDLARFNDSANNVPGIISHANIGGAGSKGPHSDGAFHTLYLWLRMHGDVSRYPGANQSERALNAAIDLCNNHAVPKMWCADRKQRFFIDVTSVHR